MNRSIQPSLGIAQPRQRNLVPAATKTVVPALAGASASMTVLATKERQILLSSPGGIVIVSDLHEGSESRIQSCANPDVDHSLLWTASTEYPQSAKVAGCPAPTTPHYLLSSVS